MRLIHIEWDDAAHHGPGEWVDPADIVPGVRVVTVGFLLSKTGQYYTVAQSIDDAGNATGVFSIPRTAVRRYSRFSWSPSQR